MWKPGQLITINGRVYRIRKATFLLACHECGNGGKSFLCVKCLTKIPVGCYPKLLTPKTSKV